MNAMMEMKEAGRTPDLREQLSREKLLATRYKCRANRLLWAMRGLCNRAEREGVDTAYFRALANEMEGGLQ